MSVDVGGIASPMSRLNCLWVGTVSAAAPASIIFMTLSYSRYQCTRSHFSSIGLPLGDVEIELYGDAALSWCERLTKCNDEGIQKSATALRVEWEGVTYIDK